MVIRKAGCFRRDLFALLLLIGYARPSPAGVPRCLVTLGRAAKAFFYDGDIWDAVAALKGHPAIPFELRRSPHSPSTTAGLEKGTGSDAREFFRAQFQGQNPDLLRLAERLLDLAAERGVKVEFLEMSASGVYNTAGNEIYLSLDLAKRYPADALLTLYHEMIHALNARGSHNPVRLRTAGVRSKEDFVAANWKTFTLDEARAQALETAMRAQWVQKGLVRRKDLSQEDADWQREVLAILERHGQSGRLNISGPALEEIAARLVDGPYQKIFETIAADRYEMLRIVAARENRPLASYDGIRGSELAEKYFAYRRGIPTP